MHRLREKQFFCTQNNKRIDNKMMRKLLITVAMLVLSITAVAQESIFPAKFTAPAEYNTGKVHISVLSRSEPAHLPLSPHK